MFGIDDETLWRLFVVANLTGVVFLLRMFLSGEWDEMIDELKPNNEDGKEIEE